MTWRSCWVTFTFEAMFWADLGALRCGVEALSWAALDSVWPDAAAASGATAGAPAWSDMMFDWLPPHPDRTRIAQAADNATPYRNLSMHLRRVMAPAGLTMGVTVRSHASSMIPKCAAP